MVLLHFLHQFSTPAQLCFFFFLPHNFFQVHFVWPLMRFFVCAYVCEWERASKAMLHCLRGLRSLILELNGNLKKKRKEAPQPVSLHQSWQLLLFHITRHPPLRLVPVFIAAHLSPCHHICIHPPANYTAPFPQTTLISNDVFSACVGIRNINGG